MIEEDMNCIVPKHKSYFKQSDLVKLQKPTEEQIKAKDKKDKEKTAVDIMFRMVVKEHKNMEAEDKEAADAQRKRAKEMAMKGQAFDPNIDPDAIQTIQASKLFKTKKEDEAVLQLMKEA